MLPTLAESHDHDFHPSQAEGIPADPAQGGALAIEIGGPHLHAEVEIGAADAAAHSHAGHTH